MGRSPPGLRVQRVGAGAAAGPRGNGAGGRPVGDASANAPGSLCRACSASAGERGAGARPARPRPAPRNRPAAGARGWAARRGGRARRVWRRRARACVCVCVCPCPSRAARALPRPPPRQRRRFRLSLEHRRLTPRVEGSWGRRSCGSQVGLGTSSARPKAPPLKDIFSGLPDSRFTPASPQCPNYRSQLLR